MMGGGGEEGGSLFGGCQLGWGDSGGRLCLRSRFSVGGALALAPLPLPLSALNDALEIAGALLHAPHEAQPPYINPDNGM